MQIIARRFLHPLYCLEQLQILKRYERKLQSVSWNDPLGNQKRIREIFNNNYSYKFHGGSLLLTAEVAASSTAQEMQFSIKNFFSICNQIRKKLRIWSYLLKKFLKSDSHLPKKWFICFNGKAFKNDEKCILFYVKSSFRSQDI